MASTNQSPFYQKAEANFLAAKTNEDKVYWLDEMIKECPKHKSAEKMLAQLKIRRKKLLEKIDAIKKSSKSSGKPTIKKYELQAAIIGKTGSGKSSLLSLLTKARVEISPIPFTTKNSVVGMMDYEGVLIQLIEIPAINSEYYDKGLANTADVILVMVNSVKDIDELEKIILTKANKIFVLNNKGDSDVRKVEAQLRTRKINFIIINIETKEGIDKLKEKLFIAFNKLRIFTKEPMQKTHSEKPVILEPGSTVRDVAEKIFKGFSKNVTETKIWGPSSKFSGQKVGLNHILKDLDVVEFRTR